MYSLVTPKTRTPRKQARPIKRARSVSARSLVPSLKYNGETRFTRTAPFLLNITALQGFALGVSGHYQEILLTFSPTGVTTWGSNVNYSTHPLPNAAEIAALWERVKIEKVELTIMSDVTDHVGIGTGPAHAAPQIMIANDVNGPTLGTGSGLEKITQDPGAKTYQLSANRPAVKWTVRPKYQRLIQYTAINSSYEPATGFVASDTDIPHYGTRIGISNQFAVAQGHMTINAKFFFHCKNIH